MSLGLVCKLYLLRPGLHEGLGLIAHGPKIECFCPTIGLNKVINWAQERKLGLHPKSIPLIILGPIFGWHKVCHLGWHVILLISDLNPHIKSLGPNFKFLTKMIALFCFQIGPGPSCKPGVISTYHGILWLSTYECTIHWKPIVTQVVGERQLSYPINPPTSPSHYLRIYWCR
jgi:hypothetical protein